MTLTLSIASLRKHNACELDRRIADLRRVLPDVTEDTTVPLRVWWDLPTTDAEDRWWSLRAVEPSLEGQRLAVRAASLAGRRVLPLTREQDRPACLAAIEAAEAWAADPTEERARAAYAYAAYAAAYAYAADAAAYAARAARAARAASAAYAAYAADAAAYAARGAARAARAAYAAAAADAAAEREAQRADLDRLLANLEGT